MNAAALRAWRNGFAPLLPTPGLERLAEALKNAPVREATGTPFGPLVQGVTVFPYASDFFTSGHGKPVEACCAVTFTGWQSHEWTVKEASDYFANVCEQADKALGEGGCRYFLNWFDDTPFEKVRAELGSEIERELRLRQGVLSAHPVAVPFPADPRSSILGGGDK